MVTSEEDIPPLINAFKNNSVLNFTKEIGGSKLNFLDVDITNNNSTLETSVYRKPTDPGIYINN